MVSNQAVYPVTGYQPTYAGNAYQPTYANTGYTGYYAPTYSRGSYPQYPSGAVTPAGWYGQGYVPTQPAAPAQAGWPGQAAYGQGMR